MLMMFSMNDLWYYKFIKMIGVYVATQDRKVLISDYKDIFERAYRFMDEAIIDGNCGELCGFHCCRPVDLNEERLGMYLLPLEYEYMQGDVTRDFEIHSSLHHDMPPKIKKCYYIYCHEEDGCLRDLRPIQCRTYPFEPHIENGVFSLVIEKEQIHDCPLLNMIPQWRQAFIDGVFKGWIELMKIPIIKYNTLYYSNERMKANNILKRYTKNGWNE